ncbi:sigma-70 family RNA polymerase sigma factor [Alphaproteobacteria bacterium GH1-50]|uniref:Sigma-70 family RNA polymerase sigma factor n=1 Tax=Kangsaoukella pontilimi TaxID=2691042 RepID=A0A7C9IFV0_9RHOB|nr:sigma-70 family RNA polymerase sigma factor [Kangsaoukella pontilimi]MXQ07828.1 sigma-70 family RNA polymerase sigma factor [Kangsaoukella pontilimi]
MTSITDIEAMIARVALRDRAAFAALYDATSAKLFGVCLRVLNNRSEAEDTLQEVYLRIWAKADTYAVTGHSPMTWLITVARNLAIDRLRKRKPETAPPGDMDELPASAPGPEAVAMERSERARIAACLEELDEGKADAVRSVYLDGLTYQDLATRHDVPLNTMRTWLRRSLIKLRECLTR